LLNCKKNYQTTQLSPDLLTMLSGS